LKNNEKNGRVSRWVSCLNTVHYEKKKDLAAGHIDHGVLYHILTDFQKLGAYKRMVYLAPGIHATGKGII
jgi:hypothetical protein